MSSKIEKYLGKRGELEDSLVLFDRNCHLLNGTIPEVNKEGQKIDLSEISKGDDPLRYFISKAMDDYGKTYEQLGAKAGVSSTTVLRVHKNETNPRKKTIKKIGNALKDVFKEDTNKVLKDFDLNSSSNESKKNKNSCNIAREELSNIHRLGREMATMYTSEDELKREIDDRFGDYFQTAISIFPNQNRGADCYKGNCGITPGSIVDMLTVIKMTQDGYRITDDNYNNSAGF